MKRPQRPPAGAVETYYERNTRAFLRFGGGRSSGAIHRQLWGPGVTDTDQATRHVNGLIAAALKAEALPAAAVLLDLGCGVGGTAIELAGGFPDARIHGITISATQCRMARQTAERLKLADRCVFHTADFANARLGIAVDAAFAIESFVHSLDPGAFFTTAAAHLKPGGLLILVDDFLSDPASVDGRGRDAAGRLRQAARLAADFRRGWRVPAFMSVRACRRYASGAGFEPAGERDLSALIRLDRPRDRLIRLLAPVCRVSGLAGIPFCGNLIGGNALNAGLRAGVFTYRWLVLRKRAA